MLQADEEGSLWAMDRQTFRRIVLKNAFKKAENVRVTAGNGANAEGTRGMSIDDKFLHISLCISHQTVLLRITERERTVSPTAIGAGEERLPDAFAAAVAAAEADRAVSQPISAPEQRAIVAASRAWSALRAGRRYKQRRHAHLQ